MVGRGGDVGLFGVAVILVDKPRHPFVQGRAVDVAETPRTQPTPKDQVVAVQGAQGGRGEGARPGPGPLDCWGVPLLCMQLCR